MESDLTVSKFLEDDFIDSDASEDDEAELDPSIAKLTTKQLMQKMCQKMIKLENTGIPKIKKNLKVPEANQLEIYEKIGSIDTKQKENEAKIEANKDKVTEMNEDVKQIPAGYKSFNRRSR